MNAPAGRSVAPVSRRPLPAGAAAVAALGCVVGATEPVWAQDTERPCSEIAEAKARAAQGTPRPPVVEVTQTPLPAPWTGQFFSTLMVGRGLRLNNPFRLATPLGDTPESLSLTASFVDVSLGAALGRDPRIAHGFVTHLSIAAHGVSQQTLTPSYVQLWRLTPRWMLLGRFGIPIVLRPDLNAGFEGGLGATWFLTAGTGITTELVGSMFYGAATRERDPTGIPVVSLQVGLLLDYEVIL